MRQLLLLRHAKSSWNDRDLPDHARPLNPRGRQAAAAMKGVMDGLGLVPDLVLVSTARRTRETMEALEPWPETPLVEPMDSLYLAPASTLLGAVQEVADTVRSVLLIGHNPGLHELALLLAGNQAAAGSDEHLRALTEAYPSGALAEFSVNGPWHALGGGGARLTRFVRPRDLPGA